MSNSQLERRIIPCLDVKDGRVVKGVRFESLKDAGDPVEQARAYDAQGADELVFLDIAATLESRGTLVRLVESVASAINLPFAVGGGVRNAEDVRTLFSAGADKVGVNSAALVDPSILGAASQYAGAKSVVVAIDAKLEDGRWTVWTHGGTRSSGRDAIEWAKEAVSRGASEILLTAIERDGMKTGFDLELTGAVVDAVSVPVIASGGAGKVQDFVDVFLKAGASAGLAASLFHFGELTVGQVKKGCIEAGIPMRGSRSGQG